LNVLIVEDDPNLRLLWRTVFGERGFRVTESDTLAAARAEIARRDFDLVLLDLYLGRDNGLDLVEAIHRRMPDARIVVVTGAAEPGLPKSGGSVHDVLRKPVDLEDLLSICHEAISANMSDPRMSSPGSQPRA